MTPVLSLRHRYRMVDLAWAETVRLQRAVHALEHDLDHSVLGDSEAAHLCAQIAACRRELRSAKAVLVERRKDLERAEVA